jgi:3-oxoacyl-[acyl-carrier-protein] synthase-3
LLVIEGEASMPRENQLSAIVTGIGYYLPGNGISSREIEARVTARSNGFQMPAGVIQRLSGVAFRHHVTRDGIASSDMAAKAGTRALGNANADPMSVDVMIFASASHDVAEPATAAIVQEKIGCMAAHVFDVKNACNSFLNALDIAHAFIRTRRASRILVTAGEVLSPFIDWRIQSVEDLRLKLAALTLGDGGGACLIEASTDVKRGIHPGKFYSDGSRWRLSTILSGGTLLKGDMSRIYFECESVKVQSLAVDHVPRLASQVLADLGWNLLDVKLVVPHQVSLGVIQRIAAATSFPLDRIIITLDRVGNTAAASIPIGLGCALDEGRLSKGDRILLVGAAAGFSTAIIPVVW